MPLCIHFQFCFTVNVVLWLHSRLAPSLVLHRVKLKYCPTLRYESMKWSGLDKKIVFILSNVSQSRVANEQDICWCSNYCYQMVILGKKYFLFLIFEENAKPLPTFCTPKHQIMQLLYSNFIKLGVGNLISAWYPQLGIKHIIK